MNENININSIALADSIAGATILGVNAAGKTRRFSVEQLQGNYKGLAAAGTNPGVPVLNQFYSATPGQTYVNFENISIPLKVGAQYVTAPFLIWDGAHWNASYSLMDQPSISMDGYVTTAQFNEVKGSVPADFTTPQTPVTTTFNPFSAFVDTDTLPNELTVVNTDPAQGQATHSGIATVFRTKLQNAEVGRKVRFYVFRFNSPTEIRCIWASALLPAESAGLFELTGQSVSVQIGDMAGVFVDFVAGANGMRLRNSGGPAISANFQLVGAAAANTNYAYTMAAAAFRYNVGMDVYKNAAYLMPYGWGNKPNGPLILGSDGAIPAQYQITPPIVTNSQGTTPPSAQDVFVNDPSSFASSGAFPGDGFTFIPTLPAYGQITASGKITKFKVFCHNAEVGRIAYFMIFRTGSNTCVYKSAAIPIEAAGINEYNPPGGVDVLSGDKPGVGIDCVNVANNIGVYSTGGPTTEGFTSSNAIPALGANLAGTITNYTQFRFSFGAYVSYSSVYLANMSWKNIANGFGGLDANGLFPNIIGRAADMQWKGKKIIWLGTSIPADTTGGIPSYPALVGEMLGANMVNKSVPSSGITYNGTSNIALSGTTAELNAITAGFGQFSYQSMVIGQAPALIVFDHLINNLALYPSGIGTIDSMDRATLMGAFNYLIDAFYTDNINVRFLFVLPPNRYDGGGGGGTIVKIDTLGDAIKQIAKKYNSTICDLSQLSQINNRTAANYTTDMLHLKPTTKPIVACYLYNSIAGMI